MTTLIKELEDSKRKELSDKDEEMRLSLKVKDEILK